MTPAIGNEWYPKLLLSEKQNTAFEGAKAQMGDM